jgi:hypothetical protein
VSAVGFCHHTGAIAISLPARTGHGAFAVGADFTGLADDTALATMRAIALAIDATTSAFGLSTRTGDDTLAVGADFARLAGSTATATVSAV